MSSVVLGSKLPCPSPRAPVPLVAPEAPGMVTPAPAWVPAQPGCHLPIPSPPATSPWPILQNGKVRLGQTGPGCQLNPLRVRVPPHGTDWEDMSVPLPQLGGPAPRKPLQAHCTQANPVGILSLGQVHPPLCSCLLSIYTARRSAGPSTCRSSPQHGFPAIRSVPAHWAHSRSFLFCLGRRSASLVRAGGLGRPVPPTLDASLPGVPGVRTLAAAPTAPERDTAPWKPPTQVPFSPLQTAARRPS